ncbi:MAG: aminoglycoside phosphotransferase family protein [Candidatus Saganbacteria bacterium]|nr:aminoglycoside phosphotransferase family protein [Candidatus Saganbacteria bacterium]
MADFKKNIKDHLKFYEGKPVSGFKMRRLGSGWHGEGFEVSYEVSGKRKSMILRTQRPIGFSHEYASDRAKAFLLQHELSGSIPKHIRSIDVLGAGGGRMVSLREAKEFYQIVEKAEGTPYMEDLERIKKTGKLNDIDRKKALILSNYLVDLHSKKFTGEKGLEATLRKRHLRDTVGHGEMLMGVLDTYPQKVAFSSKKEIAELICKAVRFEQKARDLGIKLSRMHGDFHPGNIWFKENGDFMLLDASREIWGFPADDVTALSINYIWFALMQRGKFDGPFKELFEVFWKNYLKKMKYTGILKTAALFFAFRGVVVAHPIFYKNQSDQVRRKIFNFIGSALEDKIFDHRKIDRYMR